MLAGDHVSEWEASTNHPFFYDLEAFDSDGCMSTSVSRSVNQTTIALESLFFKFNRSLTTSIPRSHTSSKYFHIYDSEVLTVMP